MINSIGLVSIMGRYIQEEGKKGSLKWIQILINRYPNILDAKIRD